MKLRCPELFRTPRPSEKLHILEMQAQNMLEDRDSNGRRVYIFRVGQYISLLFAYQMVTEGTHVLRCGELTMRFTEQGFLKLTLNIYILWYLGRISAGTSALLA
jgi:hypothetical protein